MALVLAVYKYSGRTVPRIHIILNAHLRTQGLGLLARGRDHRSIEYRVHGFGRDVYFDRSINVFPRLFGQIENHRNQRVPQSSDVLEIEMELPRTARPTPLDHCSGRSHVCMRSYDSSQLDDILAGYRLAYCLSNLIDRGEKLTAGYHIWG